MSASQQTLQELIEKGQQAFRNTFGYEAEVASFAPGRVNLIGEHIDYNDGFALPMALSMGTVVMGARNKSQSTADIITFSEKIDGTNRIQFDVKALEPSNPAWANYVKGVIYHFNQNVPGFNAVIVSNVPMGAGVSSSAALEVSTLLFIEALSTKRIASNDERAKICVRAEHTFAGTPCGIMDQMISLNATANHALLIDFRSLESWQIPFMSKSLAILICNSNVRHKLSDGEYGKRREQCSKALELMGLKSFRDVQPEHLSVLYKANDQVLINRTKHVIEEIQRTMDAAEALKNGDFKKMGELMKQSHTSLRDLYEVSCEELDALVDVANSCPGVLGSRMTGGGFGGSTVTLLETQCVDTVISNIKKMYKEKYNREADCFVVLPSAGARIIKL